MALSDAAGVDMHFSGTRLRSAIERALNILGDSAVASLLQSMQANGFRFEDDSSYTLQQVTIFLHDIFGEGGTELMMRRLIAALG